MALTSSVAAGVLDVNSDAADAIAITCVAGSVKINGADPDTGAALCAAITSITVDGGPLSNAIDLSGVVAASFTTLASITVNGGDGADLITGSEFADALNGGAGSDVIRGGAEDDTMSGGAGSDFFDGQDGSDTVDFSTSLKPVRVNLPLGVASGDGPDRMTQVENLIGSAFDDLLMGDALANHFVGGLGNDRLKGRNGGDTLDGGAGNDFLQGGGDSDVLLGGADNDRLLGHTGRDLLIGGLGSDGLVGGPDDDILIAGTTDHDADNAALTAIMAEWTSVRDYVVRVNNLRDGSGSLDGVNGTTFLSTGLGGTVHDDAAADTLTGASDLDWFFARTIAPTLDTVTDQAIGELLDEI